MLKTTSYLTAAAMFATLPTFAAAQNVAVSLSASLDVDGDATSVSVAAALGDFAVASSVATVNSTGAASGATDNSDLTPAVGVIYSSDASAYETIVTFGAAEEDADEEDIDCGSGNDDVSIC